MIEASSSLILYANRAMLIMAGSGLIATWVALAALSGSAGAWGNLVSASIWISLGVAWLRRSRLRTPLLAISDEGLEGSAVLGQRIPWSDVIDITYANGGLTITLRDPEAFIARIEGGWRQRLHGLLVRRLHGVTIGLPYSSRRELQEVQEFSDRRYRRIPRT